MIDVDRLDKHLALLDAEIRNLRERPELWARGKAERFEKLRQDLLTIRREKQMTGMNGSRIDG